MQELNRTTVESVPAERRRKLLEKLVDNNITFEPPFTGALLQVFCKELPRDDVTSFIKAVQPFCESSEKVVDVFAPRLRDIVLADIDVAALCLKLFIHERLVPLVCDGAPTASAVERLCLAVKEMMENRPDGLPPLLSAGLEERFKNRLTLRSTSASCKARKLAEMALVLMLFVEPRKVQVRWYALLCHRLSIGALWRQLG